MQKVEDKSGSVRAAGIGRPKNPALNPTFFSWQKEGQSSGTIHNEFNYEINDRLHWSCELTLCDVKAKIYHCNYHQYATMIYT